MEYKTFCFNLSSVQELKEDVASMDVYAVVSISGDPLLDQTQSVTTPVASNVGTNPTWNYPIKFIFNDSLLRQNHLNLEIKIKCKYNGSIGAKDINHISIPLLYLVNKITTGDGKNNSFYHCKFKNKEETGLPEGVFYFSFKFEEIGAAVTPEKAPPLANAEAGGVWVWVPTGATVKVNNVS